jgi:L-ribulokinase
LPEGFALEHPQDFLDGLEYVVHGVMQGIAPEQVVGIGLDITSATVLFTDDKGVPLCLKPEFADRPHAWMKLWKHHGALEEAARLQAVAEERGESWLNYYGGWISSELLLPKAVETAVKDPEVFAATYNILEAADWIVWVLTGEMTRSITLAGCNSNYRVDTGYPSAAYFKAAYPEAEKLPEKLVGKMVRLGDVAGYLTEQMAEKLGLAAGTPVGASIVDSHAGVIGCGAASVGDMVSVIGTSANNMLNAEPGPGIPGIQSSCMDSNVPGVYGYEGGQNCVGDAFAWFARNCVPKHYQDAADAAGKPIQAYLTELAEGLAIGESGLMILDWFNGVRAPLMDFSLTATIVGLTIRTKPEELYRAMLESAVFGNKRIIDTYEAAGHPVKRIIVSGGIPLKNPLMMQIYADVCNRDIYLCGTTQGCALGSAILGASAAGPEHTGCETFEQLTRKYVTLSEVVYHPIAENVARYETLYRQYVRLCDQMAAPDSVGRELLKIKKG